MISDRLCGTPNTLKADFARDTAMKAAMVIFDII
jgi:hypothetical protein